MRKSKHNSWITVVKSKYKDREHVEWIRLFWKKSNVKLKETKKNIKVGMMNIRKEIKNKRNKQVWKRKSQCNDIDMKVITLKEINNDQVERKLFSMKVMTIKTRGSTTSRKVTINYYEVKRVIGINSWKIKKIWETIRN